MRQREAKLQSSSPGRAAIEPEGAGAASGKIRRAGIVAAFSVSTVLLLALFGKSALQKAWDFRRTEEGYRVFFSIPKAREPAPDFALPALNGGAVRLSDLRGRVVFLTFRTTW
ncbi:MAG: redoxin domain-containing protein [Candidatus Tectomicrobia bacterium]|nr:redoxin domain-containing protein [Candidatus Tectomicrobia bacterium]